HRPDLGHRVEGLELLVYVRSDVGDPVTLPHPHPLKSRRPAVATFEELLVGEAQVPVDYSLAVSVQLARTPAELERCERGFHAASSLRIEHQCEIRRLDAPDE